MSRYHTIRQYVCPRCCSPAQEMDCSLKPKTTGEPSKKTHSSLFHTIMLANETPAAKEGVEFLPLRHVNGAHYISCNVHWMGEPALILES